MEKIIEQIKAWAFLSKLPKELEGFTLQPISQQDGMKYFIFAYQNENRHRKLTILYDAATKDYLGRVTIGLTEFCDTTFIVNSLDALEKILLEKLRITLQRMACFDVSTVESIVVQKKILTWQYEHILPKRIADFELFIAPNEPLKIINGSYIIIEYSNFATESNLVIYYNIYRDEFFGEMRICRTPQMTADFDASSLQELEEKLEKRLIATLEIMQRQIG